MLKKLSEIENKVEKTLQHQLIDEIMDDFPHLTPEQYTNKFNELWRKDISELKNILKARESEQNYEMFTSHFDQNSNEASRLHDKYLKDNGLVSEDFEGDPVLPFEDLAFEEDDLNSPLYRGD